MEPPPWVLFAAAVATILLAIALAAQSGDTRHDIGVGGLVLGTPMALVAEHHAIATAQKGTVRTLSIVVLGLSGVVLETPPGDWGSGIVVGVVLLAPIMVAIGLFLAWDASR